MMYCSHPKRKTLCEAIYWKNLRAEEFIQTIYLGEVEIDHTSLDLIIVDDKTFLPIGRPNLTCLVDKCSRAILGFSLSFEPPSELSVIRAIRQAIFPKATLNELSEIVNEWQPFGIPITLVVDNGLEFHSGMLRQLYLRTQL